MEYIVPVDLLLSRCQFVLKLGFIAIEPSNNIAQRIVQFFEIF